MGLHPQKLADLFSPKACFVRCWSLPAANLAGACMIVETCARYRPFSFVSKSLQALRRALEAEGFAGPSVLRNTRPLDYMLHILTDVRRLPLPCYSDPFALRWFSRAAGVFESNATALTNMGPARDEVSMYERAERTLKKYVAHASSVDTKLFDELGSFESFVGLRRARCKYVVLIKSHQHTAHLI